MQDWLVSSMIKAGAKYRNDMTKGLLNGKNQRSKSH